MTDSRPLIVVPGQPTAPPQPDEAIARGSVEMLLRVAATFCVCESFAVQVVEEGSGTAPYTTAVVRSSDLLQRLRQAAGVPEASMVLWVQEAKAALRAAEQALEMPRRDS